MSSQENLDPFSAILFVVRLKVESEDVDSMAVVCQFKQIDAGSGG